MDDSACTRCHQSLAAHRDSSAAPLTVADSVTSFDREHHPDLTAAWAARSVDPRRIKFNHALHLVAGLTLEKGLARLSFAQLAASDRERYGWNNRQPLNQPVQLACASCHASEVTEGVQSVDRRAARPAEPPNPGAYLLPIVYENHCAACHSLQFDSKLPEARARHGITAQEVFAELKQFYMAEAAHSDPDLLRQSVPPRPMPGQTQPRANQLMQQAVDDKVLAAAKLLFGAALDENVRRQAKLPAGRRGCVECHTLKAGAGPIVSLASLRARDRTAAHDAGVDEECEVQSPDPSGAPLCRVPRGGQHVEGER